ncbi:MAG TPA: Uma2 family endonuclease [Fimbriiglobus sp.]|nr:Uma2 family endonuclease [Fimbriiglobus sp.]
MSTLISPTPSPTAAPRPRLWTVTEFNSLGDMGLFEGRRAMLIHGVILEWGQMNPPHAVALGLTDDAVRTAFGPGWVVRNQAPLVFGRHLDPEPDLAIVPGRPRDYTAHPTTAALVVEIADSSLTFDTTEKAELYAAAGIPDYWVVDVEGRRLLVFRDPAPITAGGHAYRTQLTLGPADSVSPLVAPSASVAVADLLP